MADTIKYRFVMRRALAATWVALNEVLLEGEYGYEKPALPGGKGKVKVGDGVTPWNDLPYFTSGGGLIVSDVEPTDDLESGLQWIDPTDGTLYVYYDDGSSVQWVEFGDDQPTYAMPAPSTSGDLATEILADSPRAYYKMDETSGTVHTDSSGNGYDMAVSSGASLAYATLIPTEPTKKYVRTYNFSDITSHKMGLTMPMNYSYTIMFVVMRKGLSGTMPGLYDGNFRLISCGGSGETTASNFQQLFPQTNSPSTDGRMRAFWESGAGVDNSVDLSWLPLNQPSMIHFIKNSTDKSIKVYVNGVLHGTVNYTNEPSGGTDPSVFMNIAGPTGTGGHWAFFNGALSEGRVIAHAQAAGLYLR